jgi:hypothetical protein
VATRVSVSTIAAQHDENARFESAAGRLLATAAAAGWRTYADRGVHPDRASVVAAIDELAVRLMRARHRIATESPDLAVGTAAAWTDTGQDLALIVRLVGTRDELDRERSVRTAEDVGYAAYARRVIAAAIASWSNSPKLVRLFVGDRLGSDLAARLTDAGIQIAACAFAMNRRGRRSKENDEAVRSLFGLDPRDVPDRIAALQRLASDAGVPRISAKRVEDQVGSLLRRVAEIRAARTARIESIVQRCESYDDAANEIEDADLEAAVLEDVAVYEAKTRDAAQRTPPRRGATRGTR